MFAYVCAHTLAIDEIGKIVLTMNRFCFMRPLLTPFANICRFLFSAYVRKSRWLLHLCIIFLYSEAVTYILQNVYFFLSFFLAILLFVAAAAVTVVVITGILILAHSWILLNPLFYQILFFICSIVINMKRLGMKCIANWWNRQLTTNPWNQIHASEDGDCSALLLPTLSVLRHLSHTYSSTLRQQRMTSDEHTMVKLCSVWMTWFFLDAHL